MTALFYPRLIKRVRAVLIDSVLVPVSVFATLIAGDALGLTHFYAKAMMFVLPIFVLEPAMVAFTGGTVGHHLMKIRVTRMNGQGNINIVAATLRFLVKFLFGWLSFIFALTTSKHQALHDMVARSLVIHKDTSGLAAYDVLSERRYDVERYIYPPVWRRIIVVIAYCVLVLVVTSFAMAFVSSAECMNYDRCSMAEKIFETAFSLLWLGTSGWIVVFGWSGRLYGCRKRPVMPCDRE